MFDKIPYQRILALFTLFCVGLTACTPAPALTPTATMPVETPTPSATVTEAPTATATVTPDPNMPPGEGVFKKDGKYYKPDVNEFGENITLEWVPIQFAGDAEKGIKGHWSSPHGDLFVMEKDQEGFGLTAGLIPVKFEILEGSRGPKISSQPDASHTVRGSFGQVLYSGFNKLYYVEHFGHKQPNGEYSKFLEALKSPQGASLTIRTMDGETHEITLSHTSGVIVREVDLDTALNDTRFQKRGYTDSNGFMYVYNTVENGQIVSYVAPDASIETLTEKQVRQIILFSLISFSLESSEEVAIVNKYASLYTVLYNELNRAGKGDHPVVEIEYPPLPTPTATP